jgi:hypothetical protein
MRAMWMLVLVWCLAPGAYAQEVGRWVIRTSQSTGGDSPSVFVTTSSREDVGDRFHARAKASLSLRCHAGKTDVILQPNMYVVDKSIQVRHRIDGRPAQTTSWVTSSDRDSVSLQGTAAVPFIKSLFQGRALALQLTPLDATTQTTISFDVSRAEQAAAGLRKVCGW